MDVASGIFDFLSSQRDPPATVTPKAEDVSGTVDDITERAENSSIAVNEEEMDPHKSPEGSDAVDLFSAVSDSLSPPIPLELVGPERWDFNELFDPPDDDGQVYLGDDVVMASPSRHMESMMDAQSAEQTEVADNTLVTEDDFNFFDSPADVGTEIQPILEEVLPHETASGEASEPVANKAGPTDDSSGEHDVEAEPSDHIQQPRSPTPLISPSSHAENREREQAPSAIQSIVPEKRQTPDFIPIPFNPLLLVSEPVLLTFPYDPPTPAPTPESLRPELVDRLRKSQKTKYDYTATWVMDSDLSDVEEDEEQTFVPLTPVSEVDTEDLQSTRHPATPLEGSGSLADFEYSGGACVGAEWFGLKDTPEVAKMISRPWSTSWVEVGHANSSSALAKTAPRLDKHRFDMLSIMQSDRFAREVIANRHFRGLFITTSEHGTASEKTTEDLLPLLCEGVTLGSLVESGELQKSPHFTDLSRHTRR